MSNNFRAFAKQVEDHVASSADIEAFINNYDVEDMNLEQFSVDEALKAHDDILAKYRFPYAGTRTGSSRRCGARARTSSSCG